MLMRSLPVFFLSLVLSAGLVATAQDDLGSPGGYLGHFGKTIETMNQTYMNYLSAVAHGKSARKVEKLRVKTLDAIMTARGEIVSTPGFKGDKTYRDATNEYIKTCYAVFNEDYHKIADMEEIAEQSYDAMEAYLLAQKKAGEKLKEASDRQHQALVTFAAKNNVKLVDAKDELDEKLEKSGKVNDYYDKVYLIFFKSYRQDLYLTDAVNKLNLSALEQSRNALETYSTEGLQALEGLGSFQTDATLVAACKAALNVYREMATKKMEPISNFVLANENFATVKKAFEAISASRRTQADVDNYNKAVNEINKASNAFNKANAEINKQRNDVLNHWNEAVKDFMDAQIPYAK